MSDSPFDAEIPKDSIFLSEAPHAGDVHARGQAPPPPQQLPIFLDMRVGELFSLGCAQTHHPKLGPVLALFHDVHRSSAFRRGIGNQHTHQGTYRFWCNVPNGSWFSKNLHHYGDGAFGPELGYISTPDNPIINVTEVWWKAPAGFHPDQHHPEFVLDCWAYESGVKTYEANWVHDGTSLPAYRRVVPHSGDPRKRILVLGP